MNTSLKWLAGGLMCAFFASVQAQSVLSFRYKDDNKISPYYIEAMYTAYVDGIFTGTNGYANPKQQINRAEAATAIFRAKGLEIPKAENPKKFADVPVNAWYSDAIQEMVARGWMKGNPNGTFAPEKAVNKAELYVLLYRAFEMEALLEYEDNKADIEFSDVPAGIWYESAVRAFNKLDLHHLKTPRFSASSDITREEAAWLIVRTRAQKEFQPWYKEAQKEQAKLDRLSGVSMTRIPDDFDFQEYEIEKQTLYAYTVPQDAVTQTSTGDWVNVGQIVLENKAEKNIRVGELKARIQYEGNSTDESSKFELKIEGGTTSTQIDSFYQENVFLRFDTKILAPQETLTLDVAFRAIPDSYFLADYQKEFKIYIDNGKNFIQSDNGFDGLVRTEIIDERYLTPINFTAQ
jgi:hypothetical protein